MQKQTDFTDTIKTRYPEPVVIVTAKDSHGKPNPMAVGWSACASSSPAMMTVAITPKRYTAEAIRYSRCFTITFPAVDMAEQVLFFGTNSGRNIDKLKETHCITEPAAQIDSVLFTDAVANFECVLEDEFATGDHIIFVGRVILAHANTEPKARLYAVGSGGKLGGII